MQDAKFDMVHTAYGRCHKGFVEDVQEMQVKMAGWTPNKPVLVTGHSKGGGEAVVWARIMAGNLYIPTVITFGQPRVGNRQWVANYEAVLGWRTWRVRHQLDIVTLVPPLTLGYRHAQQEAYLNTAGRIFLCPSPGRVFAMVIATLLADLFKAVRGKIRNLEEPLVDHFVAGYQRDFPKAIKSQSAVDAKPATG